MDALSHSLCRRLTAGGFLSLIALAVGCLSPSADAAAGMREDGTVDYGDGLVLRLRSPVYRGGEAAVTWRDIDGDGTDDLLFRAVLVSDGRPLTVAFLRRPGRWERYVLPGTFR